MKALFAFVLSLCLSAAAFASQPDFTALTNMAVAIQDEKDVYYNDVDTHQSAATLAADRADLDSLCQQLRDALAPYPETGGDGPDFNYLRNVAYILQAEKDFLYSDMDSHQSSDQISGDRDDLDYWCQDMIDDLSCFE